MRFMVALMIVLCVGFNADAQNKETEKPSFSLNDVKLNKVGRMELNMKSKNGIKAFRNGVDIFIKGETSSENIHIKADAILFDYASKDDSEPIAMKLTGNVYIEVNGLKLECQRGLINLKNQIANFYTVESIMAPKYELHLDAEEVEVNLDNGDFVLIEGKGLDSETETKAPAE